MLRWAFVFGFLAGSAAEAGQLRSSFQVGLTITGPARVSVAPPQATVRRASVPLPRPRPAGSSVLITSDTSVLSSQ
jgi:hypothetical protein